MPADLFGAVRRNHALEHATISLLLRRLGRDVRMVGRATGDGYYLYADVPQDMVEDCTRDALARLKSGEGHLAVSPLCGTNIAIAGALAAVASMVTLGTGRRAQNLPAAICASMVAVVASQPLGRLVQRHLTTSPDLADTEIVGVRANGRGGGRWYKVQTARRPDDAAATAPA